MSGTNTDDSNLPRSKKDELETFGNILSEKICDDCGLRMYEDNRKPGPGVKPNRHEGYFCKMCDSGIF